MWMLGCMGGRSAWRSGQAGSPCSESPSPPSLPRDAAASPVGPQHTQLCPHDPLPSFRLGTCAGFRWRLGCPGCRDGMMNQRWDTGTGPGPTLAGGPTQRATPLGLGPMQASSVMSLQARVPAPWPETTVCASVSSWSDAEGMVSWEALPRPHCLFFSARGLEPCSPGGCWRSGGVTSAMLDVWGRPRDHTLTSFPEGTLVTMCPPHLVTLSSPGAALLSASGLWLEP